MRDIVAIDSVLGDRVRFRQGHFRKMLPNIVQLGIDEAAAEGSARIGSIIVLVTLVRSLEASERQNQGMRRIAEFLGKSDDRQFGLMPLVVIENIDRAAVLVARRAGPGG